jgi:hypothetical protein
MKREQCDEDKDDLKEATDGEAEKDQTEQS